MVARHRPSRTRSAEKYLLALAQSADNFNQDQVHVRRATKDAVGHDYAGGSYVTKVMRWELDRALSTDEIREISAQSGLKGLTFGEDFVEAYYVGDPKNDAARTKFYEAVHRADGALGQASGGVQDSYARLWPYGRGQAPSDGEEYVVTFPANPSSETPSPDNSPNT